MPEHIIIWLLTYRYFIVVPFAIIEGPILALICGFLIHVGVFSFWPIYLLLMAGDLVSDVYWYYIGRWGGRRVLVRYGKYFNVTEENLHIVEALYHKHYEKILLISKVTMGFGFAVPIVATAGLTKVPFKKYMLFNMIGQPVWTGMLIAAGYFLGGFYLTFSKGFELVSLFAMIVVVCLALWGFSKYIRAKAIEKIS